MFVATVIITGSLQRDPNSTFSWREGEQGQLDSPLSAGHAFDQAKDISKSTSTPEVPEAGLDPEGRRHRTAPTEIFIEDGASVPATWGPATGGNAARISAAESAPFPVIPFPPKPPAFGAARLEVPVTYEPSQKFPDQIETEPMSPTFPGGTSGAFSEKRSLPLTTVPEITPIEEEDEEEAHSPDAAHAAARAALKACAVAKPEPKPVNPNAKPGPARFKLVEMQDGSFTVLAPRGGTADADADVIEVPVKGAREHEPGADMEVVTAQPTAAARAVPRVDQPDTPDDVITSAGNANPSKSPQTAERVSASAQAVADVSPHPGTPPDAAMADGSDDDMPPLETIPDARPRAADVTVRRGELALVPGGEYAFEMGATSADGARSHWKKKHGKEVKERPPRVSYYRNYIRPRKAPIYTHMVVAAFGFFRERVAAAGGRELARELLEWLVSPEVGIRPLLIP